MRFSNGRVFCWGDPKYGGAGPGISLVNVQHIEASQHAFAALLADGSVAWCMRKMPPPPPQKKTHEGRFKVPLLFGSIIKRHDPESRIYS